MSANSLYFGDNLDILRNDIKSESVDLIYLDPPFNSKASYNRLFRSPNGHEPHAQITAFEDTWHWGDKAEREFAELVQQPNTDVSEMMQSLRRFLGENDMMAYLTMMANRLLELRRVLKPTGSLYLHCDPTASHYLKIVMDSVFGKEFYRNEVVWKRTSAHNDPKGYGRIHDIIFYYTASHDYTFNAQYVDYDPEYIEAEFRPDENGDLVKYENLTGAGISKGSSGQPWRGVDPTKSNRHWAIPGRVLRQFDIDEKLPTQEKLEQLLAVGRIKMGKDGTPRMRGLKTYLTELPGMPIQDLWNDVYKVGNTAKERLGYQTQKPLALLQRIIEISSNKGDVVLDPFCGCGTAIHAAERLKRSWIGVDVTNLAISLIEDRLRHAFPGITFEVHGTPKDFDSARDLAQRNKYEFQWWACSLVKAQPYQGKKKGADSGIDGVIPFQDDKTYKKIIVSVKAGENVSVPMIRDLGHVVNREKASIGFFVTLTKPTAPMRQEAVKAGFYVNPMGASVPKIQILTIEGLLAGTERPHYFDLMQGGLTSRKPEREVDAIQLGFDSAAYLSAVQTTEEPSRKDARVARAAKPRQARRKAS